MTTKKFSSLTKVPTYTLVYSGDIKNSRYMIPQIEMMQIWIEDLMTCLKLGEMRKLAEMLAELQVVEKENEKINRYYLTLSPTLGMTSINKEAANFWSMIQSELTTLITTNSDLVNNSELIEKLHLLQSYNVKLEQEKAQLEQEVAKKSELISELIHNRSLLLSLIDSLYKELAQQDKELAQQDKELAALREELAENQKLINIHEENKNLMVLANNQMDEYCKELEAEIALKNKKLEAIKEFIG